MATYNGAKYVLSQLTSILSQLSAYDEVIIVDDCSSDDTVQIIQSLNDTRIKIFISTSNEGVVKSFEKALRMAGGELIFLSDQDDVWFDNKVAELVNIFSSEEVDLIVHDAVLVINGKANANTLFQFRNSSKGVIKNVVSNTYVGCCMAFNRKILNNILPIPAKIGILHDAWIGILANFYNYNILFHDKTLIYFIRHDNNASTLVRRNIVRIMFERFILIHAVIIHVIRKYIRDSK